jgi:hypothetical protein
MAKVYYPIPGKRIGMAVKVRTKYPLKKPKCVPRIPEGRNRGNPGVALGKPDTSG